MQIIRFLIFLKKRFPAIWDAIQFLNGIAFKFLFQKKLKRNALHILEEFENENYSYRFLMQDDLANLLAFFQRQDHEQFKFFNPHKFDSNTLNRILKNPSFILFGVFNEKEIIGYFLLRCFINKQCFTGRIVDVRYQGQGIAKKMGKILHHIAWSSDFRVFGTASKDNIKSLKSYQSINNYRIIKELDNNYIYFEYLKSEEKPL